jgi:signal transduction histidine kinase
MAVDFIKRPISEIHDGIVEIVDRFGKFARCDRAAILLIDPDKRTASTYYEWVHWGVPAPVNDFPLDGAPEFYRQLTGASGTWLMYVEDFPPSDRDAAAALGAIGIHTLLNCPIASGNQLFGYASIGYRHAWHRPIRGTEQILEIAAGIVANALARERLEQKALAQHAALARALRFGSLAQLATGIAHELNQPLTAIANYSRACIRWLQGAEIDAAAMAEVLGKVSDEAIRAGDIVRNLRSHVKGGPRQRAPTSIGEIVDHACSLVAGTARDHGVEIEVEYEPDLPLVNVEPTEIEQVIINLLQNAIDTLAADGLERRAIGISVRAKGAFIEVGVADSGPGFSQGAAAKLFDQFYTTKARGLGLGLSISRELIESNGGTIRAESSPAGATFRVTLPVARAGHGARAQPAGVEPQSPPR